MRKLLLRNTLAALLFLPLLARAHSTNMTTITVALAEDGSFEMVVQLDPGEKILGYQRYFEISRMEETARAKALAPLSQQIERDLRVAFDGGRVLLQAGAWTLPNAPYETFIDPAFPAMAQLRLKGAASPRAEQLDFVYPAALQLPTPVLFRVDKAGERLPFSRVVDGPDAAMRPITLLKPPPPLLNERELVFAARVLHGGRVFWDSYRAALKGTWDTTLIPFLACLTLYWAWASSRGRWWWASLAAMISAAAFLWSRWVGTEAAFAGSSDEILLASLTVVAAILGFAPGRHAAATVAVVCAVAALWGVRAGSWTEFPASRVLPPNASALLAAAGMGCAWLAVGLLAHALLVRRSQRTHAHGDLPARS